MSSNENIAARFTGADSTFIWVPTLNGVVNGLPREIGTEYTEFNYEASIRLEEKTAGSERDASFNTTIREGKWDMKVYDMDKTGVLAGLDVVFYEGAQGNLYVYPKDNITGNHVYAFPAIVTGVKHPLAYDKNKMIELSGVKNGAYIRPLNSLV